MRLTRPSPEEQKETIQPLLLKAVQEGDTWYLVSKKWLEDWESYVSNRGNRESLDDDGPGPIDNSFLVDAEHVLLSRVEEGRDYDIVSEEAWNLLYQWYSGGPALPRKAIRLNNRLQPIVEVKLMTITFSHKEHGSHDTGVSKAETIGDVKQAICRQWNLSANEIEVWDGDAKTKIADMDKQLGELNVFDGQKFYINSDKKRMVIGGKGDEVEDEEEEEDETQITNNGDNSSRPSYSSSFASYPSSSSSSSSSYSAASSSSYPYSSYSSSYSSYSSYDNAKKHRPSPAGLVGLSNLGNTCFMNSSLQCLSNTVPLAEFFLSDAYVRDINTDNPLGLKGELAESFANLIKEMWNGHHSAVAPREFKAKLERFATQFSGYQQHDSQELLAFLLDGLHEDLNRVKKKLYASVREGDDITDEERVKESWDIHKGRNDSIIVDWFQAILKSTLVCPKCSRVSVTFDPFMYLSLPLPTKVDRSIPLVFISSDIAKPPTKYLVKVPKTATIATLKRNLGQMAGGIHPDLIIITDVFNSKFFKKFSDNEAVDAIDEDRDVIYAYEVAPPTPATNSEEGDGAASGDAPKLAYCAVYNGRKEDRSSIMSYSSSSTQLFGTPFFVSVPCNITYRELYAHLLQGVSRWMKPDALASLQQKGITEDEDGDGAASSLSRNNHRQRSTTRNEHKEVEQENDEEEEEDSLSDEEGDISAGGHRIKVVSSSEDPHDEETRPSSSYIFTICTVDSHGYREQPLPMDDEDTPLDLDNCTLLINWKANQLDLLDESKFRAYSLHSSMNTVDPNDADAITLDKCLSLYTTTERLGPDDPWYCNKCKEFQQATKKFDLWNSPRILVVHLKRFSYRNKYFREKLETLVHYPLRDLDLSRHIIGPKTPAPMYDLYAVSNHYGGMGGGHYTAYALNKGTNKWYKFDDSYVSEIDESQVVSSSAYVLFYRRRDTLAIPSAPSSSSDPSSTPSVPSSSSSDIRGDSYYNTHINYSNGGSSTAAPASSHNDNDNDNNTTTTPTTTTTTTSTTGSSAGYSSQMDLD